MKKTNIISGACFGYFDDSFADCLKCKIAESCYQATHSDKVMEVRAIPKTIHTQVDSLVKEWKPKGPVPVEVPNFQEQELFPLEEEDHVPND